MVSTRRKISLKSLVALGLVAGALLLWVVWDWNWFRSWAESVASERLDRQTTIGHLDVDLFWPPEVTLDDVAVANAPWAGDQPMARIDRLIVSVEPLSLFNGPVHIPLLQIDGATVDLVRSPEGGNWPQPTADPSDDTDAPLPIIDTLVVNQTNLTFVDQESETDLAVALQADAQGPLLANGSGQVRSEPLQFQVALADPASSLDGQLELDGEAVSGATRLEINGQTDAHSRFERFAGEFAASGDNLGLLSDLSGRPLPSSPPYELSGTLTRDGTHWTIGELEGVVGDSDLRGHIILNTAAAVPHLTADLASDALDFDDLAPLLGAPPDTGEGETASAEQRALAAEMEAEDRLLPDKSLHLDRLARLNGTFSYAAGSVTSDWPIDTFAMAGGLDDGELRIEAFDIGVADGRVSGAAVADGSLEVPSVRIDFSVSAISLKPLFKSQGEQLDQALGRFSGKGHIQGSGTSVADILGVANGGATLAMAGGEVDAVIVELAGLDLGEALIAKLAPGDSVVNIRCGIARADLDSGVAGVNGVMTTSDTRFLIKGDINLKSEELDLVINPRAMDFSLLSLQSPLQLKGPLRSPSISPDSSVILRGVAAAVLGAIAPPAAILPLIEAGSADQAAHCQQTLDELEANSQSTTD